MIRKHYVLITPVRNEEAVIEATILSVLSQTTLPIKWVIVSDGSTDRTEEIVERYMERDNWIELMRIPRSGNPSFAAKACCFNAAYTQTIDIDYDFIGSLDADISFEKDYIEFLLSKFDEVPGLGVAGTPYLESPGEIYDYNFTNVEHVSGACQIFRRDCFEMLGGYLPIEIGGVDWVAVTTARMNGWLTRSFPERHCFHHRKVGTKHNNAVVAAFIRGQKDYCLGWHPLWELFRGIYQMSKSPVLLRGAALIMGFLWASIRRAKRPISRELITFHRAEQLSRLNAILGKLFYRRPP